MLTHIYYLFLQEKELFSAEKFPVGTIPCRGNTHLLQRPAYQMIYA